LARVVDYTYRGERSPTSVLTGLDVEQPDGRDQRRYHWAKPSHTTRT